MQRVAALLVVLGACTFSPAQAHAPGGDDDDDPTPVPSPPAQTTGCPDDPTLEVCLDFEDATLVPMAVDGSTHRRDAQTHGVRAATRGAEQALAVDGDSSAEVVPDGKALFAVPMTIEMWVNPASSSDRHRAVAAPFLYELEQHSRDDGTNEWGCDLAGWSVAGGEFQTDTWTHLACTYDGDTLALYVNGARVDSVKPKNLDVLGDAGGMVIGNDDGFHAFVGALDDLRVYSRLLDDDEISQLAQD
jgi:hypothetical protein